MSTPEERNAPNDEDVGFSATRRALRTVLWIFGVVAVCVTAVAVGVAWWAGFFDKVELEEATVGPYHLLYREHRGPYEQVKFVMRDVFLYYRSIYKADPHTGFGLFYDSPGSVPSDSLRSEVGCLTDSLLPSPEEPYMSRTMEPVRALVATFPLRSFFSYMSGVMKAYPALERYLEEEGIEARGPIMELYELRERRIRYLVPVGDSE